MDVRSLSDELSDGNKVRVIGNIKKHNPYKVAKNLAELYLYPSVILKIEFVGNKIGCLVETTSKQSVLAFSECLW